MSGRRGAEAGKRPARQDRKGEASDKSPADKKSAIRYGPPLKPRRKLFVILSVIFALWVIALIAMYFATVYHQRPG